jgi:hypothetical protein
MTTFNSYGTVSQHRQAEILKPIRFRLRRPFAFSCGHRAAESDAQALDRLLGTMSVFTVGVRPRSGAKFSEIVIRWRVVLLRSKGEILGTVEAPDVAAAKGGPLLQIQRPLYPSIPVLNASRFPLPGESRQSRSCSQ